MATQIQIQVDMSKLPLLAISALMFGLSGFMFSRANFRIVELLDITKLSFLADRVLSLPFMLFMLFFAFTIALIFVYAKGVHRSDALYVLPVTGIIAVLLTLVSPSAYYFWVYFGMAATLALIAFLAAGQMQISVWNVVSKGILVLVIIAFIFGWAKVAHDQAYYYDRLVTGATSMAVDMQNETLSAYAAGIRSIPVNDADIQLGLAGGAPADWTKLNTTAKNAIVAATKSWATTFRNSIAADMPTKLVLSPEQIQAGALKLANESPEMLAYKGSLPVIVGFMLASWAALASLVLLLLSSIFSWAVLRYI